MLYYFAAILQDRRHFDTSNFQLSDDGSDDGTIVGDDDRSSFQLDHPKLSPEEKSTVESKIEKMLHRRFTVKSINAIVPNAIVDLSTLKGIILKRFKIEDIPSAKVLKRRNVDLTIIDNTHLKQGFVPCVLKEQLQHFANQTKIVCQYGEKMASEQPYDPEKNELCVVHLPDDDGTQLYYRAQFQQKLVNGNVQVGPIDLIYYAKIYSISTIMLPQL